MKSPERFVSMRDDLEYYTVHDTTSVTSTSLRPPPPPSLMSLYCPLGPSSPVLPSFPPSLPFGFLPSFPSALCLAKAAHNPLPLHSLRHRRDPPPPPTFCRSRLMHAAAAKPAATSPSSPGTSARPTPQSSPDTKTSRRNSHTHSTRHTTRVAYFTPRAFRGDGSLSSLVPGEM